jgi:hypothetical protein
VEATRIVERIGKESGFDLEGMEFYIRQAMLSAGARVLGQVLDLVGRGRRATPLLCANNHMAHPMDSIGLRSKTVRTILGEVEFTRSGYVCPICGQRRYPGDELLGIVGAVYSPGARRLCSQAGSDFAFGHAGKSLLWYAGLHFDDKEVERVAERTGVVVEAWMARQRALALAGPETEESPDTLYVSFDGTGVPMRRAELGGVKGKNGKARMREAKLGCVFTQTAEDEEGRPVRDESSTTYTGAIEESRDFGARIHQEALRRGMARAGRVVVITDGAAYNKTIIDEHFPHAVQILDLYHAREHLADFFRDVLRRDLKSPLHRRLRNLLDAGQIEALLEEMAALLPRSGARRRDGLKQIAYFRRNAHAMRYAEYRRQNLFVGSGVIEAGCRTLVGQRLKNSGMFWSVRGANAIIALRCCIFSNRFEDFWEAQVV